MGEGKIIAQSSAIGGSKMRVVQQQGRSRRLGICHHTGSILPAPLRLLQDLAKVGGVVASSTIPSIVISSATSAQSSSLLQRRNAIIRKNSAPATRAKIEIANISAAPVPASTNDVNQLVDVTDPSRLYAKQRCSLTAVSQGLSIISTSAVVVLYVSDRRPVSLSSSSHFFRRYSQQPQQPSPSDVRPSFYRRRSAAAGGRNGQISYPVTRRGVRHSFPFSSSSSCIWNKRGKQQQRRRWSLGPVTSWIQPSGVFNKKLHQFLFFAGIFLIDYTVGGGDHISV